MLLSLKYGFAILGVVFSLAVLVSDDLRLIVVKDRSLYTGILVASGGSLGIIKPSNQQTSAKKPEEETY